MKVSVDFDTSPDASEWASYLADNGWKITELTADRFECEKVRGNSSTYPVRQPIHWYVGVEEIGPSRRVSVAVEVPVFADSIYAQSRLLNWVKSVADVLDGEWETETDLEIDILGHLRR